MKKSSLICPICGGAFHHRVKRTWFLKYPLFFIPIKVYYCGCCEKDVYVLFRDQPGLLDKPAW